MSASMAEGIAEVLMQHSPIGRDEKGQYCNYCGHRYGYAAERKLHQQASEHIADVLAANGYGKLEDAKAPEVRYATLTNGETELDEVVAFNAYVHLEVMADNHWWMKISAADTEVDVNLYTKRAKITAHEDTYRRPE